MKPSSDYAEMLRALNDAGARYLVVGAYAVMHHAEPRYTKDMDLWIDATSENAERVLAALRAFGAPTRDVDVGDLTTPELVYQVGVEPVRVDFLTSLAPLEFAECYERASAASYDGAPIRVLSLADLVVAKEAAGRPQDKLDLKRLRAASEPPRPHGKRRGKKKAKPRRR